MEYPYTNQLQKTLGNVRYQHWYKIQAVYDGSNWLAEEKIEILAKAVINKMPKKEVLYMVGGEYE